MDAGPVADISKIQVRAVRERQRQMRGLVRKWRVIGRDRMPRRETGDRLTPRHDLTCQLEVDNAGQVTESQRQILSVPLSSLNRTSGQCVNPQSHRCDDELWQDQFMSNDLVADQLLGDPAPGSLNFR